MLEIQGDRDRQGWGQPGAIAVKFACSALAARGSLVRILGADLRTAHQAMLWRRPTYKVEEDGHGCQPRANLPQQKEEDWQQMLARG